jgi:hypothetical protein
MNPNYHTLKLDWLDMGGNLRKYEWDGWRARHGSLDKVHTYLLSLAGAIEANPQERI